MSPIQERMQQYFIGLSRQQRILLKCSVWFKTVFDQIMLLFRPCYLHDLITYGMNERKNTKWHLLL